MPLLLRVHQLRGQATAERRRLLRVLLLWLGALSADSGRAVERTGYCFLLCGLRRGQRFDPILSGLAWQPAHQPGCVVDSTRGHACRVVTPSARSRGRLDGCALLDGRGMHSECATMPSHALPLYRTVLSRDGGAGARSRCRYRVRRDLRVDRVGRPHCCRQQAHLVGDRTCMGQILIAASGNAGPALFAALTGSRRSRKSRGTLFEGRAAGHLRLPNEIGTYDGFLAVTSQELESIITPAASPCHLGVYAIAREDGRKRPNAPRGLCRHPSRRIAARCSSG